MHNYQETLILKKGNQCHGFFIKAAMLDNALLLFAHELFTSYGTYCHPGFSSSRFTQEEFFSCLKSFDESGLYQKSVIGTSGEGRPLAMYTVGSGPVKVLLWSQMHGDEPTATMAICDIFGFLRNNPSHEAVQSIREKLTLYFLPMLNPDGAERFTRRTAQLIDMNRDALALVTPEAQILKSVRDSMQPEFGFNLHDQDPRLTAGAAKKITAIALLAPAADELRSDTPVRLRAKHVASVFAEVLMQFIDGHIAKWDDMFEPRAFGDNIQRWGTSTVLVESGGWPDDPNKFFIRKLNAVGLLCSLFAIATGEYASSDLEIYERIPFNTKYAFDYLIRNATYIAHEDTNPIHVDVGINYETSVQELTGKTVRLARVVDVGDLRNFTAFQECNADSLLLDARHIVIDKTFPAEEVNQILKQR